MSSTKEQALDLMQRVPLIDGHNDWANTIRGYYGNQLDTRFEPTRTLIGHVDLQRILSGGVGGIFLSAYVDCPKSEIDFSDEAHFEIIRDSLQQIDLIHRLVELYGSSLESIKKADDIMEVFRKGKVAGIISIEGLHQIGNSSAVLRNYYRLGVRCATLTHKGNNMYATSATSKLPVTMGLSEAGREVVREMNRIGMLIDLSHTSERTVADTLDISVAPVAFTHSSCYALVKHPRNVSDDVLRHLKVNRGIIMISLVPNFTFEPPSAADVTHVVDHIVHAASIAGFDHVGIGSDFDGMPDTVNGLEDASKFPSLVEHMLSRGIASADVEKVVGLNIIRVLKDVETVAELRGNSKESVALQETVKPLWNVGLIEWCKSKWPNAEH